MSIPALVMSLSWERMPVDMFCWLCVCVCLSVIGGLTVDRLSVCVNVCMSCLLSYCTLPGSCHHSFLFPPFLSVRWLKCVAFISQISTWLHCLCCSTAVVVKDIYISISPCLWLFVPAVFHLKIACLPFSLLVPLDSTTSDSAKSKVSAFFYWDHYKITVHKRRWFLLQKPKLTLVLMCLVL